MGTKLETPGNISRQHLSPFDGARVCSLTCFNTVRDCHHVSKKDSKYVVEKSTARRLIQVQYKRGPFTDVDNHGIEQVAPSLDWK